jgi:hypothetical protein
MGEIRESSDPEMKCPSSWFGFGDLPIRSDILIDDIVETVLIKNPVSEVDVYKFNEFREI